MGSVNGTNLHETVVRQMGSAEGVGGGVDGRREKDREAEGHRKKERRRENRVRRESRGEGLGKTDKGLM